MFDFKHIKPFDRGYIDNPGSMVGMYFLKEINFSDELSNEFLSISWTQVFATPGMLHAGLSLQIFKKWAPNENNMVIMPGKLINPTLK